LSTAEIEFGVEEVIEVDSLHDLLSTFGNSSKCLPYLRYIEELGNLAKGLSGRGAEDLEELSKRIFTDVHLFYEGGQPGRRSFIKLWSEFPSLYELCEKGPKKCLERRLNTISRVISSTHRIASPTPAPSNAANMGSSPPVPEILIEHVEDPSLHPSGETSVKPAETESHDGELANTSADITGATSAPKIPEITIELVEDFNSEPSEDLLTKSAMTEVNVTEQATAGAEQTTKSKVVADEGAEDAEAGTTHNDPIFDPVFDPDYIRGAVDERPAASAVARTQRHSASWTTSSEQLPHSNTSTIERDFAQQGTVSNIDAEESRGTATAQRVTDSFEKERKDLDKRHAEEPIQASESFILEELKASKPGGLVVTPDQKDRSQDARRGSLPGGDGQGAEWEDILEKYDSDLHDLRAKLESESRSASDFTLPSKERIKFRWIHVPANNMLWGPAVLQALATELKQPSLQRALLHRRSFNALQHVPRHKSPHGRFITPTCLGFFPESQGIVQAKATGLSSPIENVQMSLFFPYLHWDTLGDLKNRNDLSDRRRRQGRPYPTDPGIFDSCLEHQLIWWYLNSASDLPLHIRRSLDQYGYPNLSNTKARDLDQILSKRTCAQHKFTRQLEGRIAQMWARTRTMTSLEFLLTLRSKSKSVLNGTVSSELFQPRTLGFKT
jgi:hypothetical protein